MNAKAGACVYALVCACVCLCVWGGGGGCVNIFIPIQYFKNLCVCTRGVNICTRENVHFRT